MDYFLATDFSLNSLKGWKEHSLRVYRVLNENEQFLSENFKRMLAKMEHDDWLYNYREDWGIKFSIQNVLNKAKYLDKDIPVFQAFLDNKEILQKCYDDFFPDLLAHAKAENALLQLQK